MNVYGVKDTKEHVVGRGIFCAVNDGVARRMLSITLSKDMNPIGLEDKILVNIGTFDENTGIILPNKDNVIRDVCSLKDLFNDVREVLLQYGKK